jgi:hypothetical protein
MRSARARKAGHEDGALERFVFDLGVKAIELLEAKPTDEHLYEKVARDQAPESRQWRFGSQRIQQDFERLAEALVAEILEPRLLARTGQQRG